MQWLISNIRCIEILIMESGFPVVVRLISNIRCIEILQAGPTNGRLGKLISNIRCIEIKLLDAGKAVYVHR